MRDMVKESRCGPMEQDTKVNGKRIKLMGKVNSGMWMEMFSMESGKMIKLTDTESILM